MSAISIVFDDGYADEYNLAFPLFKKYNVKGCSAITSGFIGHKKLSTGEPYATKVQLLEMQDYDWEILSHGKSHVELANQTIFDAELEIKGSKHDLIGLGFNVHNLVYPCHSYDDNIKYIASQHYQSARGKHGVDMTDKYALSGIMIDDASKLKDYQYAIASNKEWLIFYCHLCTSKFIASTVQDRINTVEKLIRYAKDNNTKIKTVKEMISELTRPPK